VGRAPGRVQEGSRASERDPARAGSTSPCRTDTAGSLSQRSAWEALNRMREPIRDLPGASAAPFPRSGSRRREVAWAFGLLPGRFPRWPSVLSSWATRRRRTSPRCPVDRRLAGAVTRKTAVLELVRDENVESFVVHGRALSPSIGHRYTLVGFYRSSTYLEGRYKPNGSQGAAQASSRCPGHLDQYLYQVGSPGPICAVERGQAARGASADDRRSVPEDVDADAANA
jgi:hypothetical protein